LLKALMRILSPRVDEEGEMLGLDLHQHGEKGYTG
jgi:ammonia channel protein AmtB